MCDSTPGLGVAKVTSIQDDPSPKATRWIVQKVDLDAHERRIAKDKALSAIKKKMEVRGQKMEETAVYEVLAREDEGMRELLAEYKMLTREVF